VLWGTEEKRGRPVRQPACPEHTTGVLATRPQCNGVISLLRSPVARPKIFRKPHLTPEDFRWFSKWPAGKCTTRIRWSEGAGMLNLWSGPLRQKLFKNLWTQYKNKFGKSNLCCATVWIWMWKQLKQWRSQSIHPQCRLWESNNNRRMWNALTIWVAR